MSNSVRAWYFTNAYKRLRYGDGRLCEVGAIHDVLPPLKLCGNGLHGSICPIDALKYAPGLTVWRTRHFGKIRRGSGKLCSSHREYLSGGIDVSGTVLKFARMCALDVVHLWDAPKVVLDFLKTGNAARAARAARAATCAARAAADVADAAYVADAAGVAADAAYAAAYAAYAAYAADAAAYAAADAARAARAAADTVDTVDAARAARAACAAVDAVDAGRLRQKQSKRLTRMLLKAVKEQSK